MSNGTPNTAVKQARKALLEKIKNDWEFRPETFSPPRNRLSKIHNDLNDSPAPDLHTIPDDAHTSARAAVSFAPDTEWRERTYAESDPSTEQEDNAEARDGEDAFTLKASASTAIQARERILSKEAEEAIEARRQARKRRRRKRLEEDMEWNHGLRFWEARRDAWCAARRIPFGYDPNRMLNTEDERAYSPQANESGEGSGTSTPRSGQDRHTVTIVPIAQPLLPNTDPTRSAISPSLYPSIYEKVVKQGLVPSIPINLSHMIPALVQGWQDDGEWPPKSGAQEPTMANRKDIMSGGLMARGKAYGAPAKEGDLSGKRSSRGAIGGFIGAMSGIMGGGSTKKEQQQPHSEEGYRRLLPRHLRNRSSLSAASTSEMGQGAGPGIASDVDIPGSHGLIEEQPVASGGTVKKGVMKVGRVLKGWSGSPAAES